MHYPTKDILTDLLSQGKKICINGAGGFGREVLCCLVDVIAGTGFKVEEIASFMVSDEDFRENKIMGIDVFPRSAFRPALYAVVVAIGNPAIRKKAVESLPEETSFITIIHPSAVITEWVELGEGAIITAGSILTCNIKIGKHAHLNLHTTIGHDCEIGDFFTTAPSVNISGNCKIGEGVYLGSGAAVRQGITICSNVTIGMGAVVVKDIREEGVYVGVPARKLEKR